MGIKGLKLFLLNKGVTEQIKSLKLFANKKLILDAPFLIHRAKNCSENWVDILAVCINYLASHNIKAIFIFDGCSPPEKLAEKLTRRLKRKRLFNRMNQLKTELEIFKSKGNTGEILLKTWSRLNPIKQQQININVVEQYVLKNSLNSDVTVHDIDIFKQLITAVGFVYVMAPGEAELCGVKLVATGFADAIVSFDSDIIAAAAYHRVSSVYTNISSSAIIELNIDLTLDILGLTHEQFLDFCILCGTDFNTGIPKLGPIKAYEAIKTYKTLENMAVIYDLSHFNFNHIRDIFKDVNKLPLIPPFTKFNSNLLYHVPNLTEFSFIKCVQIFDRL
ncbi:Putative XPG/RAD2-type nuclease [Lymphocystis disease virus 1]|uniref:Putative XPG/RAD2-type nuclease n=1 Tax=Fish lymphocystis disease virus TaxID=36363 RepID=UPI0000161EBE|nr:Putative XPG/RAD2-type nuclease [Lymphocystis disease virus 1]